MSVQSVAIDVDASVEDTKATVAAIKLVLISVRYILFEPI